jgi:phosphatidylinositol alpha-mannosyltransferase
MKIGLVCSESLYFPGGVQEHVKGLYNFLKSRGHEVKVIVPRYKKSEDYGMNFILLGSSKAISSNSSKSTYTNYIRRSELKRLLTKEKFDILHFHNLGLFMGLQLLNLSQSTNIITVHASPDGSNLYKFGADIFRFWIRKSLVRKIDGGILISEHLKTYLPKNNNKPISIIPNGIDPIRFNSINEKIKKLQDGKINILFVGRIEKRKGLPYLIEAFDLIKKRQDNIRLIVVGDGYDKRKCEKIVKRKKMNDVVFVGQVSIEDLPKYYATADIFCSPALYGESFGIVLAEAMASGKPVVAFANDGYKRVLIGRGRNFLAAPKDTKDLARKLEILIKDKKLSEEMGKCGIEELNKYRWEVIGKRIEDFYMKIINKNKET